MTWTTTRFNLDLSAPKVMGIVNTTPDSFSEAGRHLVSTRSALAHGEQLLHEGADILDIGGESTRPGAVPVPLAQELARVLPVVREAVKWGVPISVDTYKPAVMQAVLDLGADIINDIWALRWTESGPDSGAALSATDVVLRYPGCGLCLMHMHGNPLTMQVAPMQGDVLLQVLQFLKHQSDTLCRLGVKKTQIVIDPGIGFGKTVAQNFSLLARQRELADAGYPLLAGWSRKSSLGAVADAAGGVTGGADVHPRMVPSVAAALLAVERGASIVRVHDVRETVQALKVWHAISSPATKIT